MKPQAIRGVSLTLLGVVAASALVSACSSTSSYPMPQGTLVYSTPNPLPAAWTPTTTAPTPIPGWQVYHGVEVELWLPKEFVGGDPIAQIEELLGLARAAGAGYEGIVQALEQRPENLRLYCWELATYATVVGVTRHDAPAETAVDAYVAEWVNTVLQQFPGFNAVSQGTAQVGERFVGRAVLDLTQQGAVTRQISYLFKEGASVWVLGYAFPADRYAELLPMVETSVLTFRGVP